MVDPYKAQVGDRLTPSQIRSLLQNAGEPQTKTEKKVLVDKKIPEDKKAEDPTQDQLDSKRAYKYPLTMDASYPAYLKFTVIKIDGRSLFDATGIKKVFNDSKAFFNELTTEKESVADQTTDAETKQQIKKDSNEKKPETVSYENNTGGKKLGTITLPLQTPLRYEDMVKYDNSTSLGILGGISDEVMMGRNPFAGATQNGQLKTAASAMAGQAAIRGLTAAGTALTGGLLAGKLGGLFGAALGAGNAEGLSTAAASTSRIASAPNYRTIFKEVPLRPPFAFDFKMIALNAQEAKEIKNIVTMFREELYPEKITLGDSGLPIAYKFPNLFEIEVVNRFGNNPGFKIQRCYLTDMQTTFNETQNGMYDDGQFIEVTINIRFQEIVAMDKQKVRDGY